MTRCRSVLLLSVLLPFIATFSVQAQQSLQALVDSASGTLIEVPAGEYTGPVSLKEGVLLVGAGAEQTTLLVPDGAIGVTGANKSGILGFTIRGGMNGVRPLGRFMGVFECRLEGQTSSAVCLEGGSGAIVNNVIAGSLPNVQGVVVVRSNPLIANNVIVSNGIGVRVSGELIPAVEDNRFLRNDIAVLVDTNANVHLARNLYDGNRVAVQGAELGGDDEVTPFSWDGAVPKMGAAAQQYVDLMNVVFEEAINAHPCVIYGLGEEMGSFDCAVLSPSATFSVGASAEGTLIQSHHAYDSATQGGLASTLRFDARPVVDVINPAVKDLATDRYVLENRYVYGPSYLVNEKGQRVFTRVTNVSRIEVFCPAGWIPVSVNFKADFDLVDDQVVVKIANPGITSLVVVMEPAAGAADPYNVRALFPVAVK
jgi:hypothetical protein